MWYTIFFTICLIMTKNTFKIGSFNVRGLNDEEKQDCFARDMDTYQLDVCCFQEHKIAEGTDCEIGERKHRLIAYKTDSIWYGNGFVISAKWKENIHRNWRVSDRVCVLQLLTKRPNYSCEKLSDTKLRIQRDVTYKSTLCPGRAKLKIRKVKTKGVITIINVYAPHTKRIRDDPAELHQLYADLGDAVASIKNSSDTKTSLLLIAGDWNAKVGKSTGNEPCLGSWSRGRKNNSGQALIDFCNNHNLFITNSAFQHPARHITTWENTRINKRTNTVTHFFHQIDYILCEAKHTSTLINARSYAGTSVNSDHRLVVTNMSIAPYQLFKNRVQQNRQQPINSSKLLDPVIRERYQLKLNECLSNLAEAENVQQRWDNVIELVKKSAEEILGLKTPSRNNRVHDIEIELLSKQQKDLRNLISCCNDAGKLTVLKAKRNKILHTIASKTLANREAEIDAQVQEIDRMQDHTKIFKAVKMLKRKKFENPFVHDEQGKRITNPEAIYNTVREHFKQHFYNEQHTAVDAFVGNPSKLNKPITIDEVKQAIKRLNNNRASDHDGITAELIKYASEELHEFICETLNDVLENHHVFDLGTGILVALQKPKKLKGPVKNLRPVILLLIIRKILSNITYHRIKPQYEKYISPGQCAYRPNRSTADAVWAHRWVAAKAQKYQIVIYITGLDMTAAFDTINREKLMNILTGIIGEDEIRMVRLLLSKTTLDVKVNGVETEKFTSNVGSPQGDGISGILFNIYLEDSLQDLRSEVNADIILLEHSYAIPPAVSMLPDEIVYADDTDFLNDVESKRDIVVSVAADTLKKHNLQVNNDKTEHTVIKRSNRDEETWRYVKKLGSLLGDSEDIANRKQLAIVAMNELSKVWIRKDRIRESLRLELYKTLVKHVLTYNCGTWGLTKKDEESLDAFHRDQLRRVVGKRWPHRISNQKLYQRCNESPISNFIIRARWKLLGHILRADPRIPAFRAMLYYFQPTAAKGFRGRPRCTIATTLDADIKRAYLKNNSFVIRQLRNINDFYLLVNIAQDRQMWRGIVNDICNSH